MSQRILYVSGTRADFGLMARTLRRISATEGLSLGVAATGMHLSERYGMTVNEIEAAGLTVELRIPVDVDHTTGEAMASAVGIITQGLAAHLAQHRPDAVLLLGDRGEMLAAAIAALYQNIPVIHLHGGERSGTVDEPVRHAISKLSHYHFVATPGARERLVRMGEAPDRIHVTGAPGLDGLAEIPRPERAAWCRGHGLDPERPVALFVFHPVVQSAGEAAAQARAAVAGLRDAGLQLLALMPNADAGGNAVRAVLEEASAQGALRVLTHWPRDRYLEALSVVDLLAGNSSSGIIESASFQLPVLNIGDRQRDREQSGNAIDVAPDREAVCASARAALALPGRGGWTNIYGDGQAADRIAHLLRTLPLDRALLEKTNAY
ncbi:GDP/UDP-N,N'-diacetylbacillosamine 2-epimerase (hydrolysing) [Fluviicoccus keumensis]|uniref:GDP/UDP-N,N'-diacetylbacillosamine 2-epimerase (Hydrolysing) n=1 Tax=Fluviicoccus keumensis TaxID=1435465 RepID=A0A4Q7Z9R6_9GAMM|nr:UDP-N-acetylglucosamine 2-epimerase [Fluviicoccus keumensis]RZU47268.1 GDP/UDP-N,N'-diacetylbacillosamine 2-epimerase (hydrolysing) [Fluviicoccus keumensis]